MTAEKDPRIEAVAKLLFTGPMWGFSDADWESWTCSGFRERATLAAEDVLRGIDEAAVCETMADLEALPDQAVIRDTYRSVIEKNISDGQTYWREMGDELGTYANCVGLPAQILWMPERGD